jgi:hypothetical protein
MQVTRVSAAGIAPRLPNPSGLHGNGPNRRLLALEIEGLPRSLRETKPPV